MATTSRSLRTVGLTRHYGSIVACEALDLEIYDGEFFSVVGPSGSGKTTLLMMLTGMLRPTAGDIYLGEERITRTPPQKRPTCLVFQNLALFPHRTVGQNIEFPLKVRGVPSDQRKQRALELLTQLRLADSYYGKMVTQCSGGERQRVALARSLAYDPDILFFDEPLSAIDYQLRKLLQRELKDIHRSTGKTFVYVTHSLEEALVMSDRLGIMRSGHMIQVGTPDEIYRRPATKFVAEFMGEANVLRVERRQELPPGEMFSPDHGQPLACPPDQSSHDVAFLLVRPEFLRLLGPSDRADNEMSGTLINEYALGSRVQYHVAVGKNVLTVETLAREEGRPQLDSHVRVGWNRLDGWLIAE